MVDKHSESCLGFAEAILDLYMSAQLFEVSPSASSHISVVTFGGRGSQSEPFAVVVVFAPRSYFKTL